MRRLDWIVGSYSSSVNLIFQKIPRPRHRGELAIAGAIDRNEIIRGNDGQTTDEHYVFHNSRGALVVEVLGAYSLAQAVKVGRC